MSFDPSDLYEIEQALKKGLDILENCEGFLRVIADVCTWQKEQQEAHKKEHDLIMANQKWMADNIAAKKEQEQIRMMGMPRKE